MAEKGNSIDLKLLGRILRLARPYRGIFSLAVVLTIVLAPITILRPYLVQKMVDDYIFNYDMDGLAQMGLVFCGVLILEVFVNYSFIYSTNWLGQSVIRDLRVDVFSHITKLKLGFFDKTPIGTLTTRTINDIETINTVFSQGAITIIADMFKVVAILAVMLYTSWKLTLVCITVIPLLIIATYIFKEKVKASYQRVRSKISEMNAFLQEGITGMRIVQIFGVEEDEAAKFKNINRAYTQANLDAILYYAIFFPVVEIISASSLGLMVWWGASAVIKGSVSLGVLIAFPIYLSMLFRPIRMLADKFNTLQMGMIAADRVFTLLDREEFIQNHGADKAVSIKGDIEFKDVSFAYVEDDYVLKNVNLQINAGETLAIVGSTGSGKSTIINILSRFYEVQKGEITIDGKNIKDYSLEALRNRMAIVLQDVFLFSGSVYENITLRDDRITKEQVLEAAKMIGAHEFIERLPGGYDYEVMERGGTLSMGQRQLISFVRALVFDPSILILDEATSSIDPETERIIQYAIEKLIAKRTSIIIAHRLSTIRHAENILVLNKGKVMEFGSHEELLKIDNGHYRELYEMQFVAE